MANDQHLFAEGAQSALSSKRTGIEVYCQKPWSRLGASPKCTITATRSGVSAEYQLTWDTSVFIALEPGSEYRIRIRRPSDFISFKATLTFSIAAGEVEKLVYESPVISFMAGKIKPLAET